MVWFLVLAMISQQLSSTKAFLQVGRQQPIVHRHSSLFMAEQLQDLEISDTVEGSGDVAKFDTIVTIQYTGRFLETSEQFDQGMISFKVGFGKVIDGCDDGIRGMKVGGTRQLKIPAKLGFGASGNKDLKIPPDADLEYTVELKSVAKGPMAEAAANMGIGLDPNTVYLK